MESGCSSCDGGVIYENAPMSPTVAPESTVVPEATEGSIIVPATEGAGMLSKPNVYVINRN